MLFFSGRRARRIKLAATIAIIFIASGAARAQTAATTASAIASPSNAIFDIRVFGAIAGGDAPSTGAIQAAIDACTTSSGGTVLVPAGTFITGTLYLRSNVCLRLDGGAVLLGSPHIADYTTDTDRTMYNEPYMNRCLIFARDAENISIEGMGTID